MSAAAGAGAGAACVGHSMRPSSSELGGRVEPCADDDVGESKSSPGTDRCDRTVVSEDRDRLLDDAEDAGVHSAGSHCGSLGAVRALRVDAAEDATAAPGTFLPSCDRRKIRCHAPLHNGAAGMLISDGRVPSSGSGGRRPASSFSTASAGMPRQKIRMKRRSSALRSERSIGSARSNSRELAQPKLATDAVSQLGESHRSALSSRSKVSRRAVKADADRCCTAFRMKPADGSLVSRTPAGLVELDEADFSVMMGLCEAQSCQRLWQSHGELRISSLCSNAEQTPVQRQAYFQEQLATHNVATPMCAGCKGELFRRGSRDCSSPRLYRESAERTIELLSGEAVVPVTGLPERSS